MKTIAAIVFLGVVALSSAGLLSTIPATTYAHAPIAYTTHAYSPIAYTAATANYLTSANYRLTLDTSLPGSAYAAYPYAAAPTAYGYGVIKTL